MIELSEKTIDYLSEKFEAQWDFEAAGPVGVSRFLRDENQDAQADRQLAIALIQIDMERSWMVWCNYVKKVGTETDPTELTEQLSCMPYVHRYSGLFRSQLEFTDSLGKLAHCEFACRAQWGDSIGSHYYEHNFAVPIKTPGQLNSRNVRCEFDPNLKHADLAFPLNGKNAIGRQRSTDKLSSFVERLPDGNRIVVADRREAEISRNQLGVQLLTNRYAIATNLSSVNPVLLSDSTKLQPTECRLLSFPFSIGLSGRRLIFS